MSKFVINPSPPTTESPKIEFDSCWDPRCYTIRVIAVRIRVPLTDNKASGVSGTVKLDTPRSQIQAYRTAIR